MKLNPIQVAASAAGAIASATIASYFGVQGTILGVAIGSVVATTASALVGQWIEKSHEVVRQVVVKNADQLPYLRHGRPTGTAGHITAAQAESPVGTDLDAPVDAVQGGAAASGPGPPTAAAGGAAGASAPSSEAVGATRLVASSRGGPAGVRGRTGGAGSTEGRGTGRHAPRRGAGGFRLSLGQWGWRPLAVTAAVVFVVALGIVTVLEVAAGRPLSSLVGGTNASGGTSAGNLFGSTPVTATTTTTPPATTTTTTPAASTTTTTASAGAASTTTTSTSTTTTTTTVPSGTASPGAPGG